MKHLSIGTTYNRIGSLDGSQMEGHLYFHDENGMMKPITGITYDGLDIIFESGTRHGRIKRSVAHSDHKRK